MKTDGCNFQNNQQDQKINECIIFPSLEIATPYNIEEKGALVLDGYGENAG